MKSIKTYVTEKLKISKSNLKLAPETLEELAEIIKAEIRQNGNSCSLNHIDVSEITDMKCLFGDRDDLGYGLDEFNGDISEWDVSKVTNMYGLFWKSKFNGDLSKWDISNVRNMKGMFYHSSFNNNSICDWNVSKVKSTEMMFMGSDFKQDLSNWKINPDCPVHYMFNGSLEEKYKPFKNGKRVNQ